MDSYWSVDSIYHEDAYVKKKNALIRMVHYTENNPPGTLKIAVHKKLLDKGVIDFGRMFAFNRSDLRDYYSANVVFQEKNYRLPYFTIKNMSFLTDRRAEDLESILRNEIQSLIRDATDTNPENNPVIDGRIKMPIESKGVTAKIFVFNVGQGDTILLEFPDNNELWMIDAYFIGKSRFHYDRFKCWMVNRYGALSIQRLVLSHLHHDHIKSAHKIINDFSPKEVIFTPTLEHPTATVRNLFNECNARSILRVLAGDEVTNFSNLSLTLKRTDDFRNGAALGFDPNNHGIAIIIETNKSFALLPGDIPGHLLHNLGTYFHKAQNKYRFYKVTHHCSYTGYHRKFLSQLNPCDAATSCSSSNRFGHPSSPPKDHIDAYTQYNLGSHRITCYQKEGYLEYVIY